MIAQETFTLADGVAIPKLGFGTWMIDDREVAGLVQQALALGYRHVDTAQAYANERGVGEGLRASGIARDELFVTTKLAAECKSYSEARTLIDDSLAALGVGQIDLMLIHSPQPWTEFRKGERYFAGNLEAWRALEEGHAAGKLRAIGVSNFDQVDLDNILENAAVKPGGRSDLGTRRQHAVRPDRPLQQARRAGGSLFSGRARRRPDNPGLSELAAKYGVSVAQLCIRYCLELGLLPLPKTVRPEHLRSNIAVDFEIAAEDMATLKGFDHDDYGDAAKFPVFGKSR
ncbi:diketogulonate reductase-like aldo/keto reductase [Bradyrhizobium sp. GM6.1]